METFKPLNGIKVLDFSHVIAGPLSTFYLSQLGADVVKVENRHGGDVMRRGRSLDGFVALNAGKQGLRLDLADADDHATALKLAGEADVLVDSLRPGVLERHGLGDAAMRAANPRLIYCAISGFGRQGPWAGRPAYDHVIQAATGMMLMAGLEGEAPIKTGFPVVDAATGILAALAIVAAIHERASTGLGRTIDVSMTASAMQLMYTFACGALTHGVSPPRIGNQGYSGSPAADLFETSDGWIASGANTPRQLIALLAVLGRSEIGRDPACFETPLDAGAPAEFLRAKDPQRLRALLAEAIRGWSGAALEAACAQVGVPCSRVRTIAEFASDARANDGLGTVPLSDLGCAVTSPGLGFRVS